MATHEGMDLDEMAAEVEQELEGMVARAAVDRGEHVLDLFRQLRAGWKRAERPQAPDALDDFATQASAALGTLVTAQFQEPLPAASVALAVQTLARVALGEDPGTAVLKARAAQSEAHRSVPLMGVDPETWEEMLGTGALARQVIAALCVLQWLEERQEHLFAPTLPAGEAFGRGTVEGLMARARVHMAASSTGRCWCWEEATPSHAVERDAGPVSILLEVSGFPMVLRVQVSRLTTLEVVRTEALCRTGHAEDGSAWVLFWDDGRTPVDLWTTAGEFVAGEVVREWEPYLYLGLYAIPEDGGFL